MSDPNDMTPKQTDRARELLDQSVEKIDPHTVHRLQRARAAALRSESPTRAARPGWLVPAAGLAVAASLVLAVMTMLPTSTDRNAPAVASVDDIEILFAKDDLNLYEDLEFYAWLDEEPG